MAGAAARFELLMYNLPTQMCNEYLDVVLPISWGGWIDEVKSILRWVLDVGQQQSLSTHMGDNQVTLKVHLPQSSSQAVAAQQGVFLVVESPLTILGQLEVFLTWRREGVALFSLMWHSMATKKRKKRKEKTVWKSTAWVWTWFCDFLALWRLLYLNFLFC